MAVFDKTKSLRACVLHVLYKQQNSRHNWGCRGVSLTCDVYVCASARARVCVDACVGVREKVYLWCDDTRLSNVWHEWVPRCDSP